MDSKSGVFMCKHFRKHLPGNAFDRIFDGAIQARGVLGYSADTPGGVSWVGAGSQTCHTGPP